jgi:hypothetical protein
MMARRHGRLTDSEREVIQVLRKFGPLNAAQTARALRCSRTTVRYWQAMQPDGLFMRPKGAFARGR